MESERLGTSDDVGSPGVRAVLARTTLAIRGVAEVSRAYRILARDDLGRSVFATFARLDLAAALGNASPVGRALVDAGALGGSNTFGRPLADAAKAFGTMVDPDIRQLLEDRDAARDADHCVGRMFGEDELDTPIAQYAAEMSIPRLARRLQTLSEAWPAPSLGDAADQLLKADAELRASDDGRVFARIIHTAVSALEEVARQLAGRPSANPRVALQALDTGELIAASQRALMAQAWTLRNGTPGAGHGAGRAPREVPYSRSSGRARVCASCSMSLSARKSATAPLSVM